jgi:hypothetical protein
LLYAKYNISKNLRLASSVGRVPVSSLNGK